MPISSQVALSNFREATNNLLVAEEHVNEAMNATLSHNKFFIKSQEDFHTLLQLAKKAKWDKGSVSCTASFDRKDKDIKEALQLIHIRDKVKKMKLNMVALNLVDYKE
ncbi:hypothetical protein ACE6H2_018006 [Prunus campanulata]